MLSEKLKIFIVLSILIWISSCSSTLTENSNVDGKQRYIISKETAIYIARGLVTQDYSLAGRNVSVEETNDSWIVTFKETDTKAYGGDPRVTIDKSNGRINDYKFPK